MPLDHTHNPQLRSWVEDANGHPDFPIQNLPFGIFSPQTGEARPGIAIGDHILDLPAAGLLPVQSTLNAFLALGPGARVELRHRVCDLLGQDAAPRPDLLHRASDCRLHLPVTIPNYTDFYAGIHHATNVGRLFRPDNPLLPNYKWVPIGYHGRASSVRPSGVPVVRPSGQTKGSDGCPEFGPTRALDFELELGLWLGPGNELGTTVPIGRAQDHIAGYCLLNDWSARDLQSWEYQPLGPFLAKSFHTTVSPWIVTPEALAPFRQAQPPREPRPLPYLWSDADQQAGALNLQLEVFLETGRMRAGGLAPHPLSRTAASQLFWTPAQLVAHHSSNGCNLQPGDLFGTGTISSPDPSGFGSLLELTGAGAHAITLPNGEQRTYLEDGDEILLRATARREGFATIGFGECRARISAGK